MGWLCRMCKHDDGKPFRNFTDRKTCHKCKVAKGACFLRNAPRDPGSPSVSVRKGTQQSGPQLVGAGWQQFSKRIEAMEKLLQAGHQAKAAKSAVEPGAASPEPDAEWQKEMVELNEHIKKLESIPGPEVAAALEVKKERRAELLAAHRAAKPVDEQITDVEGALERKKKALQRHDDAIENRRKEIQAQQEAMEKEIASRAATQSEVERLEQLRKELYGKKVPGAGGASAVGVAGADAAAEIGRLLEAIVPSSDGLTEAAKVAVGALQAILQQMAVATLQMPGGAAGAPSVASLHQSCPSLGQQPGAGAAAPGTKRAWADASEEVEETEAEEAMEDDVLAAIVPTADAGELVAIRARLKEGGLWIRSSRRKPKHGGTK